MILPPLILSLNDTLIITNLNEEFKMKVYALIGKSGTGKSFQAVNLCRELNIESIIDDGLFICRNKVMAGISAKRQPTKVGAVKTALFTKDGHMEEVKGSIKRIRPSSVLVIGTSDGMVDKIVKRLDLPRIIKRIYIEDITTEAERAIARKQRTKWAACDPCSYIPAETAILGIFYDSCQDAAQRAGIMEGHIGKIRCQTHIQLPGDYKISEKVMADIVECVRREHGDVAEVGRVAISPVQEGIEVYISANFSSRRIFRRLQKPFRRRQPSG